jgi:hypothetical protein
VQGHIYTLLNVSGTGLDGAGFQCDLVPPVSNVMPCWVAFDPAGNAVLATDSKIEVIAVHAGVFYGQHMKAGHVYLIAGGGKDTADGTPALKARIPTGGLAVDGHGNIMTGRKVIAEASGTFFGKRMRAGDVFSLPEDALVQAIDSHGNALVVSFHSQVQVIANTTGLFYGQAMVAGHVYTIAGDGSLTSSGDGGPAIDAGMAPGSAAVDTAGNVLISDGLNAGSIRVVAESDGTFYGQDMTAGDIYTIAGGGTSGADDLPALDATIGGAPQLAIGPFDTIIYGEAATGQVRQLG